MEYAKSVGWWNCIHRGKSRLCRLKDNSDWSRCECIVAVPTEKRREIFYKYYKWNGVAESAIAAAKIKKEIRLQSYKLWLRWVSRRTIFNCKRTIWLTK